MVSEVEIKDEDLEMDEGEEEERYQLFYMFKVVQERVQN